MRPLTPNPDSARRAAYPGFDWLRIGLASVVVIWHAGLRVPGLVDGPLAVNVFFALSGWLIGGILLRAEAADLPRFFLNRATRIWLPYAAAIVLLYGFAALAEGVGRPWSTYLLYDTTFTHQIFARPDDAMPLGGAGRQFWSLSVEEQFYLLAPAIMMFLTFGKKLLPWAALGAIGLVTGALGTPIVLGVIAAILHRDHGDWHARRVGRIAVAIATAGLFAALHLSDYKAFRMLFAIGVVLMVAMPGERHTLPVFLGGVSFPLYLNHWVGAILADTLCNHILHLPWQAPAHLPVFVTLAYVLALAFAALAYLAIDRPALMRRAGWYTPARATALAVTGYGLVATGLIGGVLLR